MYLCPKCYRKFEEGNHYHECDYEISVVIKKGDKVLRTVELPAFGSFTIHTRDNEVQYTERTEREKG